MNRVHQFGVCIMLVSVSGLSTPAAGQQPARSDLPGIQALPQPEGRQPGGQAGGAVAGSGPSISR